MRSILVGSLLLAACAIACDGCDEGEQGGDDAGYEAPDLLGEPLFILGASPGVVDGDEGETFVVEVTSETINRSDLRDFTLRVETFDRTLELLRPSTDDVYERAIPALPDTVDLQFRCNEPVDRDLVITLWHDSAMVAERVVPVSCSEPPPPLPECGDGVVNRDDEQCDGADIGDATCEMLGFSGGVPSCTPDCEWDLAGSCGPAICGDGMVVGNESCDGELSAGFECLPGYSGRPVCNRLCNGIDYSGCYTCGDQIAHEVEACDGDDLKMNDCVSIGQGFVTGTLGCTDDCAALDTSQCLEVFPPCTQDIGNTFAFRCEGPGFYLGQSVCRFIDGLNFANFAMQLDPACVMLGYYQIALSTGAADCTVHPDTGGVCVANDSPVIDVDLLDPVTYFPKYAPDLMVAASDLYVASIDSAAGIGSYVLLRQMNNDDVYLHTLDATGRELAQYGPYPNVGGQLQELYARVSGTQLHVTVRRFRTVLPEGVRLSTIVVDTADGSLTRNSALVDEWLVPANAPQITTTFRENGDIRAYVLPNLGNTIQVTDYAAGTLAPSSVGTISLTGGTLLDFDTAHAIGSTDALVGQVSVGGTVSVWAYRLDDTPQATLNLSAGDLVHPVNASIEDVGGGVLAIVAAVWDETNTEATLINYPVP